MLAARTEVTDRMLIFGERHLRSVLAEYAGTTTDNGHTEAADSARPGPNHPVADLFRQRIKRRAILGGLIHEYRRAA